MNEFKICAYCGKGFDTEQHNRKYCSKQCSRKVDYARIKKRNMQSYKKPKDNGGTHEAKKCKTTLSEINNAAREARMTYGAYVAKMGL